MDANTNSTVKKALIWQIMSPKIHCPSLTTVTNIKKMLQLCSASATARLAIKMWLFAFNLEERLVTQITTRFPTTPQNMVAPRTRLPNTTATDEENIVLFGSFENAALQSSRVLSVRH